MSIDVGAAPLARSRFAAWFRDLSIRRKLSFGMLGPVVIALVFTSTSLIVNAGINARAAALANLRSIADVMANNASGAVAFGDAHTAQEILTAFRHTPESELACLHAAEVGDPIRLLAAYPPESAAACSEPAASGTRQDGKDLVSVKEVTESGARVGWLSIRQDQRVARSNLRTQIAITLAILAASVALKLLVGMGAYRALTRPLLGLADTARRITRSHDYSLRATRHGNDEVGHLVDDFNAMLDQIGQTQAQLVQSERLAALGGLVAGVAHEINTPVGVGVTAASTLRDGARHFGELYARGAMKRSDLERFVAMANESAGITLKNLERAATLIQSFKQVAVDQASGERRRFELRGYIDEVLVSLAPQWRKAGHKVLVDCPAAIEVETYPGALAQILANLVSNALVHAFDLGRAGVIRISVHAQDGWITLKFFDDGNGIAPENLKRVFDPFFTTRRSQGGSGLGLNIVFNLVQQLGGTVGVASEPGRGAEFTVRFPAVSHRDSK
jgi:signal transduction histidine kinase